MSNEKPVTFPLYLMIAEDDRDDQILIRDALKENGVKSESVQFVNDGQELIDMLVAALKLPRLIMLDLNMPRKDGRETLQQIKNDLRFKHIPIIIFSTSKAEDDVKLAYQNGSNTYFTKPPLYSELVDVLGTIKEYWFEKAVVPGY